VYVFCVCVSCEYVFVRQLREKRLVDGVKQEACGGKKDEKEEVGPSKVP
jgi:hypothetical protein